MNIELKVDSDINIQYIDRDVNQSGLRGKSGIEK
jgi:hypothetical protein